MNGNDTWARRWGRAEEYFAALTVSAVNDGALDAAKTYARRSEASRRRHFAAMFSGKPSAARVDWYGEGA